MKQKPSNAALAILLGGASIVAPAFAQDPSKPVPGANLQYVGADTRLGIGIDSDRNARGELFQVFRSDGSSATLGEVWASRNAGGAKLSQHWVSGTSAVNKAFAAFDQGDKDLRKATLGGGQEYENWFWDTYLSKGLSGARLGAISSVATKVTQSGTDAGRSYEEDVTTTITTKSFSRPYDWGVGARAGQFYEAALVRITAGLDYEWGKFSSRQWTGTLTAEKFFAGSPISVALTGELFRRSGDFEGRRNDQRGLIMIRYELGAPHSSFKSNKLTRMVTSTERVPDPNWSASASAAAVAPAIAGAAAPTTAKAAEPATPIERRIVNSSNRDAQETYFDLGSSILKPAAKKELDGLVSRIAEQQPYVNLKVNVVGHTCPTGSDRNNSALSIKRADAVKAYLISKGVPPELVATSGEAGRSPKYPEVKGQSFRNRRADTDVVIVKEKAEDVKLTVPGAAAPVAAPVAAPGASPVANGAAPAVAPMIERPVQREVVDTVTNNWISRALHNTAQHKATVDSYRWAESSAASVTGARRYINRPPVAVNDAYTIECNTPATFNVLVNDSDLDNDILLITSVSAPGKGTASISPGRVVYTPAASSCAGAVDSFTYTIADGKGGTATATVAVTINAAPPVNKPPVAVNDAYTVECNAPSTFNVLANDSDPDNDTLTLASVTTPGRGSALVSAGRVVYTPAANTCGGATDSFSYTIADGKGGTATASVAITVKAAAVAVNTPPVAVDDGYTVECNAPSTFNVLLNDSDADNDALTITSVTAPGKGTASISAGRVVYIPAANTCGGATDSFRYTIADGKGGIATASVSVTVKPALVAVNTPPVAVNDAYTIDCNAPATFDVLLNDSDADNDRLTITSVTAPGKGTTSISAGRVVYTPAANTCGGATDSFNYTITDGKGGTATASVAVTVKAAVVANTPPVAVDDGYAVECNTSSIFNVLLNDSDADNDVLTITSLTAPGKGTASISAGRVVYTPAANTCGGATDSFRYTIADGRGGFATAAVAVTVKAAVVANNTPPVAVNDFFTVPCSSGAVLNVLANDSDKDGDPLTITSITQPGLASIAIAADGKSLNYTPGTRCFMYDSFTYTISDGRGGTSTALVSLLDP